MTTPLALSLSELEDDVLSYRRAREARLLADRGWLTLVGRTTLGPGRHRVGSRPGSEIELPLGAPADLAIVTLEGGVVSLEAAPGVELSARGGAVTSLVLRSDAEPEPDQVIHGSLALELLRRGEAFVLRVRDSQSAARRSFDGIPAYPIDPAWRVVARLEPFEPEREVSFDDGEGRPQLYRSPGFAVFEKDGVSCRLTPVFEGRDRQRLFVLFSDPTNRDATYGAGRFLYASPPEEGRIALDFNKAFNPPCAFTPYAVCPLPPPENRLLVRVEAGEKRPAEH